MAAHDPDLHFDSMTLLEIWQWVEANPGRVNDRDNDGETPLLCAVPRQGGGPQVLWLITEKGADVNFPDGEGRTSLFFAFEADVFNILLDCGADPTRRDKKGRTPLIQFVDGDWCDFHEGIARLLQDPRVQATVNVQNRDEDTALHFACRWDADDPEEFAVIRLLLQAGDDLTIENARWQTPLNEISSGKSPPPVHRRSP